MKNAGWKPALRNGHDISCPYQTKSPGLNRDAKCSLQKTNASSVKPGRTFLRHQFYQGRTALVKKNVSNGTE